MFRLVGETRRAFSCGDKPGGVWYNGDERGFDNASGCQSSALPQMNAPHPLSVGMDCGGDFVPFIPLPLYLRKGYHPLTRFAMALSVPFEYMRVRRFGGLPDVYHP